MANLANTKPLKMTETLAYGYSSESTQRALSSEYQGSDDFQKSLHLCAIDKSSLNIGRVNASVIVGNSYTMLLQLNEANIDDGEFCLSTRYLLRTLYFNSSSSSSLKS